MEAVKPRKRSRTHVEWADPTGNLKKKTRNTDSSGFFSLTLLIMTIFV